MPTVKEIAKAIEDFAPRHLQEDFDNAGLQVGDPDMEVKEILVCLDVTEEILDEAIAKQCNLIVTHHPLIFGGIKEISFMVIGEGAFSKFKFESGVHRVQRVPDTESSGRIHTSTATVAVLPVVEDVEIDINPADIKMEVFRASGAGGQHVNKTSSAVRLIHEPTGIVAECQTERSQVQNREYAMKMLKAKLVEIAEQQQKEKISEIQGVQTENGWGNQIRSYVFHPYNMVKDHRTNYEVGNIGAVPEDLAGGGLQQTVQLLHQGRFSGTGVTDDANKFSAVHRKRHIFQSLMLERRAGTINIIQVLNLQNRCQFQFLP